MQIGPIQRALRDAAQLSSARLPSLNLLLDAHDLGAEHVVATLDVRVPGGGVVGRAPGVDSLLPRVGSWTCARRAREQRNEGGRDRADHNQKTTLRPEHSGGR